MKKVTYLLLTLLIIINTATAEKWELIDNNNQIFSPNGIPFEFTMFDTEVVNDTIYSLNKAGNMAVIKSYDLGLNWDTCFYTHLNEIGAGTNLYGLYKIENKLFAPGDNGRLYESFDGGVAWDFTDFSEKDNHPIQHVKFINKNIGFVGLIYNNILTKTTDGGKSWNPLPDASDTFPPSFSFLNFIPIDEHNIFIIIKESTNIRFYKTQNGGGNWEEFESELFEETQFVNQEYENMIYQAPYTYVESGFKASKEGHTRIMRTIDFEKWESVFISDTISGGKRLKSFQVYENIMFGYGERIFIYSLDGGNTWVDLYDKDDEFYKNSNSDGFALIDNYCYAQSNFKYTDEEGNLRNTRKMYKYKIDLKTSVEKEISNFNIYPNPAKEEININYDKMINSIEILDLNGKEILSNKTLAPQMEQSLKIDYLNAGTYFIRINDKVYKRFVKE